MLGSRCCLQVGSVVCPLVRLSSVDLDLLVGAGRSRGESPVFEVRKRRHRLGSSATRLCLLSVAAAHSDPASSDQHKGHTMSLT